MMKNLALLVSLFAFCGAAAAESGLVGAPILVRAIGARSCGMGQAFASAQGDTENIIYNPGGLAFMSSTTVTATYLRGLNGDAHGLVVASVRLGDIAVLTPAILYYNAGAMDLNLSNGTQGRVTAEEDKVGMLSAAFRPVPFLGIGGTLKTVKLNLAETASASGTFFDVGATAKLPYNLSAGASYQNIGGDIKYESVSDPAPKVVRLGASWAWTTDQDHIGDVNGLFDVMDVILAADWFKLNKEGSFYQAGTEMAWHVGEDTVVFGRLGYLFDRDAENFTAGLGARQGRYSLNYAYGGATELSARHQFTLGVSF